MIGEYVQKNSYEVTHMENEWLVLNTDNYTITKLNDVGGYCWSLLEQPQSIDTLINAIEEEFTVTANKEFIEKDMEAFLYDLLKCGLIQHVD